MMHLGQQSFRTSVYSSFNAHRENGVSISLRSPFGKLLPPLILKKTVQKAIFDQTLHLGTRI
jgi:hypothetical protein